MTKLLAINDAYVKLKKDNAMKSDATEVVESVQELTKDVGGIDLNSRQMELEIKRDSNGVLLPAGQQNWDKIDVKGFVPVIYKITPVSLPLFLGFNVPGMPVLPVKTAQLHPETPLGKELDPVGT